MNRQWESQEVMQINTLQTAYTGIMLSHWKHNITDCTLKKAKVINFMLSCLTTIENKNKNFLCLLNVNAVKPNEPLGSLHTVTVCCSVAIALIIFSDQWTAVCQTVLGFHRS